MRKHLEYLLNERGLNLDTLYNTVSNTVSNTVKDKDKDKDNNYNKEELLDYNTIQEELLNSETWIEDICRAYSLKTIVVKEYIEKFVNHQKTVKPGKRTLDDVRRHFSNTLRKKFDNQPPVRKHKLITEESVREERRKAREEWTPPVD